MSVNDLFTLKGSELLKITKVDIKDFSSLQDLTKERPIKLLNIIRDREYAIPYPIEIFKNQLPFSSGDLWMAENISVHEEVSPYFYIGKTTEKQDIWINLYSKRPYLVNEEDYCGEFNPICRLYPA